MHAIPSFVCISMHTVTSWSFPEMRHQVDLDIGFKVCANTCTNIVPWLNSKAQHWHWQSLCLPSELSTFVTSLAAISALHTTLYFFMLGLSRYSGLWSLIWGWRSLSAMLCAYCCRAAMLRWQHSRMQEGAGGATTKERRVTWKSGVDNSCWGNLVLVWKQTTWSPCLNIEVKMLYVAANCSLV